MLHALIYHGAYELNFDSLPPGARRPTRRPTAGCCRWRRDRSTSMASSSATWKRARKKFSAVRLQFEERDIVLANPLVLEPMRHMESEALFRSPRRDRRRACLQPHRRSARPERRPGARARPAGEPGQSCAAGRPGNDRIAAPASSPKRCPAIDCEAVTTLLIHRQ